MSKIFVTSDTHFGHQNIIRYEAQWRPFKTIEEHDRELIARWNAVVTKRDTVWHLGDVFFGKDGHLALKELNGYKKLVMGNHDHYPMEIYQKYFNKIFGAAEYKNCLLTHVPIHERQMNRYLKNIHGHMHSRSILDARWRCVSVEQTNLTPILMETIIDTQV